MSRLVQRPEHLLIREYVQGLRDKKTITQEGLRDAFVAAFVEMVPPGDDVPDMQQVHRHDTPDQLRRKDQANLKKLWRAIDGETYFPLCFKAPLIEALESMSHGLGDALQSRLLHNAGLLHMPLQTSSDGRDVYASVLKEFAEANAAIVKDLSADGVLNDDATRNEVMDSIERHLQLLQHIDKNNKKE